MALAYRSAMHGTQALEDAILRTLPLPRYAYHPREVAEMIGVSERYVVGLIDSGDLPSIPLGKGRKILHEDLMTFLKALRDDEAQARAAAIGGEVA